MTRKPTHRLNQEHWAYRAERAFKKSVRREIAGHLAEDNPVYVMQGDRMVRVSKNLARDVKTGRFVPRPAEMKRRG